MFFTVCRWAPAARLPGARCDPQAHFAPTARASACKACRWAPAARRGLPCGKASRTRNACRWAPAARHRLTVYGLMLGPALQCLPLGACSATVDPTELSPAVNILQCLPLGACSATSISRRRAAPAEGPAKPAAGRLQRDNLCHGKRSPGAARIPFPAPAARHDVEQAPLHGRPCNACRWAPAARLLVHSGTSRDGPQCLPLGACSATDRLLSCIAATRVSLQCLPLGACSATRRRNSRPPLGPRPAMPAAGHLQPDHDACRWAPAARPYLIGVLVQAEPPATPSAGFKNRLPVSAQRQTFRRSLPLGACSVTPA